MDTREYIRAIGLFFQAPKDWEVGLETVGDGFFFPFLSNILNREALLGTLGDAPKDYETAKATEIK